MLCLRKHLPMAADIKSALFFSVMLETWADLSYPYVGVFRLKYLIYIVKLVWHDLC